MPRAFLITNRRYCPGPSDGQSHSRETSPERCVSIAEAPTDLSMSSQLVTSTPDLPSIAQPDSPHSPANLTRDLESPISTMTIHPDIQPDSPYSTMTRDLTSIQPDSPHSPANMTRDLSDTDWTQDRPLGLTVPRGPSPALFHATSLLSTSAIAAVLQRVMGTRPDLHDPDDPEPHGCPECGKRYTTSSNLARHRQTHRSPLDKKARKCPHCDKVYVSMPAYSMHVRTHSQGCQCPFCGKRFSRPWLLQGHIRTHTGEKPFTCPVCAKAFADKSNLRAHVQTHSTTKPFVCGRCGKAFALKSYLYKHEESSCMKVGRSVEKSSPLHSPQSPMMQFQHSDDSI